MAKIAYKLYDPETNSYLQFEDGKDVKVTDASRAKIEKYAADNNLKVNFLNLGPEPMGIYAGKAPPVRTDISPVEKEAEDVSALEAAGGGLLTGLTLDWRDEIFGKEESGVKPAEAEELAYPKIFGTGKVVGETAANILADLGILAASRGAIKSPAALAGIGGAVTGGIQALGKSEKPIKEMTEEDLYNILGEAGGGAAGGVLGVKVLGPLLGAGARYVGSKLPKLAGVKFPGRPSPQSIESRMEKLAGGAEEEMVKKMALEGERAPIEAAKKELQPRTLALEAAQKKMLAEAEPEAKLIREQLKKLEPTPDEYKEFNRIKQKSKAATKEYKKIGFAQPPSTSNKLTAEEIAEFDRIKRKITDYTNASNAYNVEPSKRAMDLFQEYEEKMIPEGVSMPDFTEQEIADILKKKVSDLEPDELFVAIEKHEGKRRATENDMRKLTDAIAKLDANIATKKRLFDTLEKRLNTFANKKWKDNAIQYLDDMRYRALGGAVGRVAGSSGGEYMTQKPGQKDYTAEALNSLLMPK